MLELQQMMEPLTTFMDEEVLGDIPSSYWVKITPSRSAESTLEHSHSRTELMEDGPSQQPMARDVHSPIPQPQPQ